MDERKMIYLNDAKQAAIDKIPEVGEVLKSDVRSRNATDI